MTLPASSVFNEQPIDRSVITGEIDQLFQFSRGPIWDGNLIGKEIRDNFVKSGIVDRVEGWNFLTRAGVSLCVLLGFLRS